MVSVLELVHDEPVPVTVAVPAEVKPSPTIPTASLTVPPFETTSVAPAELLPTTSVPVLVQLEPEPVTVAVPVEP